MKHSAIASCASLLFLPNFDVICDLLLNRRTALEAVCEILVCVSLTEKIQDWILKSEGIQKRILRFFTRQINPRSLGLWCVKGTEESTLEVDSSVPLMHHDPKDFRLICLEKKRKMHFRILSDLKIQSWIFLTPSLLTWDSHTKEVYIFLLLLLLLWGMTEMQWLKYTYTQSLNLYQMKLVPKNIKIVYSDQK